MLLVPQELAGPAVDEVQARAGLADHRFVAALRTVWSGLVGEPVLHVHCRPGASKKDVHALLSDSFCEGHVDLDQRAQKVLFLIYRKIDPVLLLERDEIRLNRHRVLGP